MTTWAGRKYGSDPYKTSDTTKDPEPQRVDAAHSIPLKKGDFESHGSTISTAKQIYNHQAPTEGGNKYLWYCCRCGGGGMDCSLDKGCCHCNNHWRCDRCDVVAGNN
ncbi:uncharacterized protein BDR25DRAFT_97887 [Lindgomyces ingoldianus]|uniref:Uncharacterized protein n=1 Tax=Lindgomyces ingoldianus TaxID=673940 RepID=A0ACB6QBI5_9PLEO|nr:uncharacterized protein BDR25DRAFT_97887 [Lindgomyces ingoldianus]KAF2464267.1 hypothetical protein BDR25DRAFT_97887 [Lindgomyces ingoldianus]